MWAPYLGRAREVLHDRLVNADDRWEGNDLSDLQFLSCAAGDCDVVVGERKHANLLHRAARRCGPRAVVVPTVDGRAQ